jgi:A/G-specific adenine glycosylase
VSFATAGLRADLLAWFDRHKRDLPWRRDRDPYRIWVSEVMLQQTQAERAAVYFKRWLARFPDVASLAAAPEDEVLKLWEGLGYYSRARNLRAAARRIVERHQGEFPSRAEEILDLPGIGAYSAGAIASQAFGARRAAVDANVERVLARVRDLADPVRSARGSARIAAWAGALADCPRPGDVNQALMELGALICLPRNPACTRCPVLGRCASLRRDRVGERPVRAKRPEVRYIVMASGILLHRGRVFIQKRRPGDVWPGLWEFPGGVVEEGESFEQALCREFREEVALEVRPLGKAAQVRYSYTRYRVTLHAYFCRYADGYAEPKLNAAVDGRFVRPAELSGFAFPAGHRRVAAGLASDARFTALVEQSLAGPFSDRDPAG